MKFMFLCNTNLNNSLTKVVFILYLFFKLFFPIFFLYFFSIFPDYFKAILKLF